ncbi:MAG TPA: hypothetical protein VFV78_09995 [Vicinamibacterales bacterium]|nr:hypothetical protein [Vicinamibacterales bacterium]
MRAWLRWCAVCLVLAACAAAWLSTHAAARPHHAAQTPADQTRNLSVMQALELYAVGDPEVIRMVATPREVGSIRAALAQDGRAWIRANGKAEESHRRLVATTFALEAVRHAIDTVEDREFDLLLRWAADEWRNEARPSPEELLWHNATLALLQGVGDTTSVTAALNAARNRFPNEPRWALVRGWIAEFASGARPVPPLQHIAEIAPGVIQAYVDASVLPDVSAEAHLHLAYLFTSRNDPAAAVDHATEAARRTTEAEIRSLAHLFRGWALIRAGRSTDAQSAFRDAHNALPASQSAALWLSGALFLSGERQEAARLVDGTMRSGLGELDPWRLYPRGDFRLWPRLIGQLRQALR